MTNPARRCSARARTAEQRGCQGRTQDREACARDCQAHARPGLSGAAQTTRREVKAKAEELAPIDPSPTIDQAINGGFPWLEIRCSRCLTPCDVDLAALPHVPTTCVHDLAGRLVCQKCRKAGKRLATSLLQLTPRSRHASGDR
jgi:hypothetical protein